MSNGMPGTITADRRGSGVGGWLPLRTLAGVTIRPAIRPTAPSRRAVAHRARTLAAAAVLGLAVLAGCSSENASTDCDAGAGACTITFDRGVEASANVLGVEAKLIGADGDKVTVEVAGEQLSLAVGEQTAQVDGVSVSVDRVTYTQVVIRIAQ